MRIRRALQARFAVATLAVRVGVTLGAQTRATTAAFAWAKQYLSSPAFATAYAILES